MGAGSAHCAARAAALLFLIPLAAAAARGGGGVPVHRLVQCGDPERSTAAAHQYTTLRRHPEVQPLLHMH